MMLQLVELPIEPVPLILGFILAHLLWGLLLFARMHHPWRDDVDGQVYLPGRFVSKTTGETFATTVDAYQHAKEEQQYVGPIYPAEWVTGFELVSELELERETNEDAVDRHRDGIQ